MGRNKQKRGETERIWKKEEETRKEKSTHPYNATQH